MKVLSIDVGVKNLSLCVNNFHNKNGEFCISYWANLDCSEIWSARVGKKWPKKTAAIGIQTEAVVYALDTIQEKFDGLDAIWIENQPCGSAFKTGGNTVMKCVQHAIQAYFLLKKPTVTILMIPSNIKLGKYAPKKYSDRKKMAIQQTRSILEKQPNMESLVLMTSAPKSDDLADAFLIGYQYYQKLHN